MLLQTSITSTTLPPLLLTTLSTLSSHLVLHPTSSPALVLRDPLTSCPTAEHYTLAVLTTGSATRVGPTVTGQFLTSGAHWLVGQASVQAISGNPLSTSTNFSHFPTHTSPHTHIEQPCNTTLHTHPPKQANVPELCLIHWTFHLVPVSWFTADSPCTSSDLTPDLLSRSCHVATTQHSSNSYRGLTVFKVAIGIHPGKSGQAFQPRQSSRTPRHTKFSAGETVYPADRVPSYRFCPQ